MHMCCYRFCNAISTSYLPLFQTIQHVLFTIASATWVACCRIISQQRQFVYLHFNKRNARLYHYFKAIDTFLFIIYLTHTSNLQLYRQFNRGMSTCCVTVIPTNQHVFLHLCERNRCVCASLLPNRHVCSHHCHKPNQHALVSRIQPKRIICCLSLFQQNKQINTCLLSLFHTNQHVAGCVVIVPNKYSAGVGSFCFSLFQTKTSCTSQVIRQLN